MKILAFPLVRITIWLVIGIACAYYLRPDLKVVMALAVGSFALLLMVWHFPKINIRKQSLFGCILYALTFLTGMATQIIHTDYLRKDHYIRFINNPETNYKLHITLREKLKSNKFSDRYIGTVSKINSNVAKGRILLNLRKSQMPLNPGVSLYVYGNVLMHKPPLNPDQFDYGKYLLNKSVAAQMYADSAAVKIIRIEKDIWYYSSGLRLKIIANLRKNGFRDEELHVVNALILGQQQDISPEVLRDYQFAGAVHILSVSGLHVGFILLFLNFLLKPLPRSQFGRAIKFVIILFFLWSFAVVAGLSPSVIRSATMFSFVAWGMYLRKSTNIFHTLLISLFLILICEPSFLFDVGFQLSYTALFFILWLQPLLSDIWVPQNKILKYFWDILTVSFAAQIGAVPLSIYYFHQFPGLFFITNLIIIPFLSVIMVLGVVVMLMASIEIVPIFAAKSLEWCIYLMNRIISWIASFEKFIIQDIPLNMQMLITSYLLIFAAVMWIKKPTFRKLAYTFVTIIIFQTAYYLSQWKIESESELIVFNTKKRTLITTRNGKSVVAYENAGQKTENQVLKSYLVAHFSEVKASVVLENILKFNNNKILIVDSASVYPERINPDIVIFTASPKINLERFLLTSRPKVIVADASNFKTYIARWKLTCLKEKIPFHSTGEKGFYILKKEN